MGPRQLSTVAGASVRRILAGGEGLAGVEPVLYDLQDLLITTVGDVLEEQWRSMAGDEHWRRP
jgi:hypothetical protein